MKKLKSTRTFLVLIAVLGALIVIGCTPPSGDVTSPTVSLVLPANLATNAAINTKVVATFSEAMNPATITATNFTLANGTTPVGGTVAYAGTSATFTPSSLLLGGTTYTATVTTGVKDVAGNLLLSTYTWSFTTGTALDTTRPTVGSVLPLLSATAVATNTAVSATFSEPMDPLTMTTANFTLKQGTTAVAGSVANVGNTATFTPTAVLTASVTYTATITTGAKDLAGNALAIAYVWTFITGPVTDTTKPTVSSTVPADVATGIDRNANLTATFSEAMAPLSVNTATFTVKQGTTAVPGTVVYVGTTATFNPSSALAGAAVYTATISTAATDLAGNALAAAKVWTFTTTAAGLGPAPVLLGTSGTYVILAKTAVTNAVTGASLITGNIGLSPAAESYYAGFALTDVPSDPLGGYATAGAEVVGKLFAADNTPPTPSNLTTAVSDMETAYTDAAGRPTPDFVNKDAGTLSGVTLTPGLYTWGSSVAITTAITISGSANDVWIFQVSGDLIVSNAVIVTLTGGAQTKNIFWQVAGQTTLGTTVQFKGIILDQTAITLQNGAILHGRALAQSQVALDTNVVLMP